MRRRRRLTEGQRLAYAMTEWALGRGEKYRRFDWAGPPAVRIVCQCGRKLYEGTGSGPLRWVDDSQPVAEFDCDRCGQPWQLRAPLLLDAWADARQGDRTVRLPL